MTPDDTPPLAATIIVVGIIVIGVATTIYAFTRIVIAVVGS